MKTALYPGSFDPITMGHLNIIQRASRIFDRVVVCVLKNSEKNGMFSLEERMALARKVLKAYPNVEVATTDRLFADYAKEFENPVIVKGLRAVSDFDYEFQIALINKRLNPQLETVFLTADQKYTYLSSSVVKEMARYDVDLRDLVPEDIISDVQDKILENRRKTTP